MPRRFFCVLIAGLILAPAGRAAEPRNVIVILTDDQALDTIGLFNPLVSTPNLDRLIRDGTWFSHALVSTSVCPASRMSVISGLYFPAHRHTFDRPRLDFSLLAMSYPALLRERGYYSGFIGKNGLALDAPRAAVLFDEWEFYKREYFDNRGVHLTDRLASRAKRFIRDRSGTGPWSLVLWFHAPHADDGVDDIEPYVPPERYENLYEEVVFPPRPGSDAWPERPALFEESVNRDRVERWQPAEYQRSMRRYHAMIRGLDDAVGKLRDALKASGQADNTLIIFLSDNGLYRGERGFGGKWLGHEASVRVPLIVVDPGRAGGATVDALVSNVDIAPTVLERLGFAVPEWMQGKSLAPFLGGGQVENWREDLFIEHSWVPAGPRSIPRTRGIRTNRYKYLEYPGSSYRELYDLVVDPDELTNLAGQAEIGGQEAELRKLTREREIDYGAAVFADGFETRDARRWTRQRGLAQGGAILKEGEAPHPWALTPSLQRATPVFVGLSLPRRDAVSASFRFSVGDAQTLGPTEVASFSGSGHNVRLLLDASEKTRWLILQGGDGSSARMRIAKSWVSVGVAWNRQTGTYSLSRNGRIQGRFRTKQQALRSLRFGLPAGGNGGMGKIRFDEFVVLSK